LEFTCTLKVGRARMNRILLSKKLVRLCTLVCIIHRRHTLIQLITPAHIQSLATSHAAGIPARSINLRPVKQSLRSSMNCLE
jgi:hypothetical protein